MEIDLDFVDTVAATADYQGFDVGDSVIIRSGGRSATPIRRTLDDEPAVVLATIPHLCDEHRSHGRVVLGSCGLQPIVPTCQLDADER